MGYLSGTPASGTLPRKSAGGSGSLVNVGLLTMILFILSRHYDAVSSVFPRMLADIQEPPLDPQTIFEMTKANGKIYFNDGTMELNASIDRPWLRYHQNSGFSQEKYKPKLRLILTDFGWNHPNVTTGLQNFRLKRSRQILQAFVDHPYFDPTFRFTEMASDSTAANAYDSSVTNIVMLDYESCLETNYPQYGGNDIVSANTDTLGGRPYWQGELPCFAWDSCSLYINKVLESDLFQKSPTSTIVFIDCGAEGYFVNRFPPGLRNTIQTTHQISFASISATYDMIGRDTDMGLPPPAVNPVILSDEEKWDIQTCEADTSPTKRNFFFSFIGTDRSPGDNFTRKKLFDLNQIDQGILLMDPPSFQDQFSGMHTFDSIVRTSKFAAAPRGDCMFSYRFTEVLSAGAIPVVHSDGW
jgi:Exostosin family